MGLSVNSVSYTLHLVFLDSLRRHVLFIVPIVQCNRIKKSNLNALCFYSASALKLVGDCTNCIKREEAPCSSSIVLGRAHLMIPPPPIISSSAPSLLCNQGTENSAGVSTCLSRGPLSSLINDEHLQKCLVSSLSKNQTPKCIISPSLLTQKQGSCPVVPCVT